MTAGRRGRGRGRRPGGERRREDRGQTTIDFAIGVSLFLLAVAFTFAFVPTMLQPFTDTSQEQTVRANRASTQLAENLLVSGDEAFVLDQRCTVTLFNTSQSSAGCGFTNTDPVPEIVGLDPSTPLNVTVVGADANGDGERDVVCESATGDIAERSAVPCETTFARGGTPPSGENSVVVSRRHVVLDGEGWILLVRVW